MVEGLTLQDWATDAEMITLCQVLHHSDQQPRAWDLVADRLSSDDFAIREHGLIYSSLAELSEDGEPLDVPHVLQRLSEKGRRSNELHAQLGRVISAWYTRLSDPSLLGMVRLIRQASRYRRTRQLGERIALAGESRADAVLNEAYESMLRLATETEVEEADDEAPFIDAAADTLLTAGVWDRSILRTGLVDVDEIFPSGLAPRTLTVIAALTSRGKTAFAMQVADRLALDLALSARRGVVRIMSLEMGRIELHRRQLIRVTGIPMECWLGRRELPWDAKGELGKAVLALKARPLRITYAGTMTLPQIRAIARQDASTKGLALLVVDYLQLVDGGGGKRDDNRAQEVARIAQGLKAISMDLDCPVLAVAQLNRAAEGNEKPRLSDLKESSGIEQGADNVLFVYQRQKDDPSVVTVRVGKQRNGPRDLEKQVRFDGALFRFQNLARPAQAEVWTGQL